MLEQSLAKSNQHSEGIVWGVANQLDETNHQIKILPERMNNLEDDIISKKAQRSHGSKHSKTENPDEPPNSPSPMSPFRREAPENFQSHKIELDPVVSSKANLSYDEHRATKSFLEVQVDRPVPIRPHRLLKPSPGPRKSLLLRFRPLRLHQDRASPKKLHKRKSLTDFAICTSQMSNTVRWMTYDNATGRSSKAGRSTS